MGVFTQGVPEPTLEARGQDARPTVFVKFDRFILTSEEAHELAAALGHAASQAEVAPDIHERHVNLKASCVLCVFEANGQIDRLEVDE